MAEMKPSIGGDGVPRCSENECPSYDGKRCELIGCRPSLICEPAVIDMADRLRTPPATGAAAMREAAAQVAEGLGLPERGLWGGPVEIKERIAAAIRALPAPEVPEAKEAKWHAADIARIGQLEQTEDRLRLCLEIAADAMRSNPMFEKSDREKILTWLHSQAAAFEARDRGEEDE